MKDEKVIGPSPSKFVYVYKFVDELWTVPDRMSSCAPDIYEPADAAVPDQVEHDFENLASNHRRKSVLVPNGRSCH